jgi:hypothetical protein
MEDAEVSVGHWNKRQLSFGIQHSYNYRRILTTSAARGSAASWINAGNPIEKNSRVNLFLSFGRFSSPLLLLSRTFEEVAEVIQSRVVVQHLLFPLFRVHVCDGSDSESPFAPMNLSDGDKHSIISNRRDGAVINTRKTRNRAKGPIISTRYDYR